MSETRLSASELDLIERLGAGLVVAPSQERVLRGLRSREFWEGAGEALMEIWDLQVRVSENQGRDVCETTGWRVITEFLAIACLHPQLHARQVGAAVGLCRNSASVRPSSLYPQLLSRLVQMDRIALGLLAELEESVRPVVLGAGEGYDPNKLLAIVESALAESRAAGVSPSVAVTLGA